MSNTFSYLWSKLRSRPLIWDTITTTGWSTFGRGVGFLVPFFIAAWFGVTAETDAFFFVYGLILFMGGIFATVIESVIVPYISELRSKYEDIGIFVGNIMSVSGLGLLVLLGLFIFICRLILPFVTKFSPASLRLIYILLFETAPLIIFLAWTSILTGVLNTCKKFVFPAVSPAIRAIICLGTIFTFREKLGVHAVAFGYALGEIIRFMLLAFIIWRLKIFKLRFFWRISYKLLEFLKTYFYKIISNMAIGFNPIVDKIMASWLRAGSVSVLHYADRLYMIPTIFIMSGLSVVILSHWSSRFYNSQKKRLIQDVRKTERILILISLVISIFLIIFNKNIVNIAFSRGVFNRAKLSEVSLVWVCYLLGFVPHAWEQIYIKGFIVIKNTKVLMKCALYKNLLNIIFNLILMKYFYIAGIALSTSIVAVFSLFYLKVNFYKLTNKLGDGNL